MLGLAVDSTLDPALANWIAQTQASGRVATHWPTGVLAGAMASRLNVADPTLSDPWDYRFAPSSIILLDAQSEGGGLDFGGQSARLAMMYSDTVSNAVNDVAEAVVGGLITSPIVWLAAIGFGVYLIAKHPERTRAYVQRWRT